MKNGIITGGNFTSTANGYVTAHLQGTIDISGGTFASDSSNVIKIGNGSPSNPGSYARGEDRVYVNGGIFRSCKNDGGYPVFYSAYSGYLTLYSASVDMRSQSGFIYAEGVAYVRGGTYTQNYGYNVGIKVINGGTVTWENATYQLWSGTESNAVNVDAGGTFVMNSGTISSRLQYPLCYVKGTARITGGTMVSYSSSPGYVIWLDDSSAKVYIGTSGATNTTSPEIRGSTAGGYPIGMGSGAWYFYSGVLKGTYGYYYGAPSSPSESSLTKQYVNGYYQTTR